MGVFLLGILDASLLFFPLGIDLLVVVLSARHHNWWAYYAALAAFGSVVGCFTTDWVGRKGGEEGLEKRISKRRLRFFQKLVAAALKYPRAKLLGIVGVFRFVRFAAEGLLAIQFGPKILKVVQSPIFEGLIVAVIVVSIVGSAWAVYSWRRGGR